MPIGSKRVRLPRLQQRHLILAKPHSMPLAELQPYRAVAVSPIGERADRSNISPLRGERSVNQPIHMISKWLWFVSRSPGRVTHALVPPAPLVGALEGSLLPP